MVSKNNPLLAILERLPVTSVIADPTTGEILWATLRDLPIVAASDPSQIIGHSLTEFLRPEQHGTALRGVEAVARGESPQPLTYDLKRVDGGYLGVQIASVPITWSGRPAMLSIITDVTEREEARRRLQESEERYRDLVSNLPDGIAVVVRERIVFANDVLSQALGLGDPREMVGRNFYDFVAEEERAAVRARRKEVVRARGAAPALPVTLLCLDGTRVPTTAQSVYVRWDGEPASQTIMRDLRFAATCEP
jgi:PAS domain S-box-containing protein